MIVYRAAGTMFRSWLKALGCCQASSFFFAYHRLIRWGKPMPDSLESYYLFTKGNCLERNRTDFLACL